MPLSPAPGNQPQQNPAETLKDLEPRRVRLTDVSPRDGLQNEPNLVATEAKVDLITSLVAAGVDEIEVTSFVSRKWIPQLGDSGEVCEGLDHWLRSHGWNLATDPREGGRTAPLFSALVPNAKGLEGLSEVNQKAGRKLIGKASVFTAASETFCRKNINATIAESIERFGPVIAQSHQQGLLVRGYISCVVACPFEGAIAPEAVCNVVRSLIDAGVDEIDLGDTIGAADEASIDRLLQACLPIFESRGWTHNGLMLPEHVTLHLHDTFGRAGACVRRALDLGVRSFDGAVGGLGGCPYASLPGKRAPGNVALDLIQTVAESMGYRVSCDPEFVRSCGRLALQMTGRLHDGSTGAKHG